MRAGRLSDTKDQTLNKNFQLLSREFEIESGETIEQTFGAVANTETEITHGLGYIPTECYAVYKDRACDIYAGTTTWTNTKIYVKCTVASAVTILKVR